MEQYYSDRDDLLPIEKVKFYATNLLILFFSIRSGYYIYRFWRVYIHKNRFKIREYFMNKNDFVEWIIKEEAREQEKIERVMSKKH